MERGDWDNAKAYIGKSGQVPGTGGGILVGGGGVGGGRGSALAGDFQVLTNAIEQLITDTQGLLHRLEPICVPSGPVGTNSGEPVETRSPLSGALRDQTDRINRLRQAVIDVSNRLEL